MWRGKIRRIWFGKSCIWNWRAEGARLERKAKEDLVGSG